MMFECGFVAVLNVYTLLVSFVSLSNLLQVGLEMIVRRL